MSMQAKANLFAAGTCLVLFADMGTALPAVPLDTSFTYQGISITVPAPMENKFYRLRKP
jgi:hypothetical protein